ncbi:MAG: glycosyltransferase [Oceanococcus sp.]
MGTSAEVPTRVGNKIFVFVWQYPAITETFVKAHCEGLARRGWQVCVLAHTAGDSMDAHASLPPGLSVDYWPVSTGKLDRLKQVGLCLFGQDKIKVSTLLLFIGKIVKSRSHRPLDLLLKALFLKQLNFSADLAHAHFGQQAELAARLFSLGNAPKRFVVTLHGFDVNRPAADGCQPYPMMSKAADRILVGTRFMQAQARSIGCPADKLQCLPVGVDVDKFSYVTREMLKPTRMNILSVCRLVPYKGLDVALRALALAKARGVLFCYRIIGDGPCKNAWMSLSSELGLAEQVSFLGPASHQMVAEQMSLATHFMHVPRSVAGDREGQGVAVQEAQATGLPIIATRHGGVPEGIIEGETGVLADEGSDESLADAIVDMWKSSSRWLDMGRRGHNFVLEEFSCERVEERLLGIYASLEMGQS